jgi:hypothetical protein
MIIIIGLVIPVGTYSSPDLLLRSRPTRPTHPTHPSHPYRR